MPPCSCALSRAADAPAGGRAPFQTPAFRRGMRVLFLLLGWGAGTLLVGLSCKEWYLFGRFCDGTLLIFLHFAFQPAKVNLFLYIQSLSKRLVGRLLGHGGFWRPNYIWSGAFGEPIILSGAHVATQEAVGKLVKWSLADFTCWKKTITTASYTLPKISTDQCVQMLAVKCGGVSLLSKRSLRKAHRLVA